MCGRELTRYVAACLLLVMGCQRPPGEPCVTAVRPLAVASASGTAAAPVAPLAPPADAASASTTPPRPPPLVAGPTAPTIALGLSKQLSAPIKATVGVALVGRSDGGAWLVPQQLTAQEPVHLLRPGKAPAKAWRAAVGAAILAAPSGGDGVWLVATPSQAGVFSFPTVERLVRLDPAGHATLDLPWKAGPLRVARVASNGDGGVWLAGTVAGSLRWGNKTFTATADGRAEVVVRVDESGAIDWVRALSGVDPGTTSALTVSTDGNALVIAGPVGNAGPVLTVLGRDGSARGQRGLTLSAGSPYFRTSLDAAQPDGTGGYFVAGQVGVGGLLELGGETPLPEGAFVARVDASGKQQWARAVDDWLLGLEPDGHGGALVLANQGATMRAFDLDAAGGVERVYEVALPEPCQRMNAWLSFALAGKDAVAALACQAYDDSYLPRKAVGAPVVYTARAPAP